MELLGLGKKKGNGCCGSATPGDIVAADACKDDMGIKILGSGCTKCVALEGAVKEALTEMGIDATVEHVTDFAVIASYGVMTTPALVAGGRILSYGKVLTKDEAAKLLKETI